MPQNDDKLNQLQTRIDNLAKYEAGFKREIASLKQEIQQLKRSASEPGPDRVSERRVETADAQEKRATNEVKTANTGKPVKPPQKISVPMFQQEDRAESFSSLNTDHIRGNIEKFVGTYLISIIGILVTIIGVAVGAKYAIDNELVSPLIRIVFGYAVGFALTGTAVYLKEKYESFSAVLLSGGMAIMYFITYFAYSFYAIWTQPSAFALMVIFTVFTVASALVYNRRIIAHIGLVGAYAVPFLLSEGSGNVKVLFGYVAILNTGILFVSVRKYWKSLFYSSFVFTWLIFAGWYFSRYTGEQYLGTGLFFLTAFFLIFYLTFLAYKLFHKKPFEIENAILILHNSFLFFGFGYVMISDSAWDRYLGIFTLANAVIHFIVGFVIRKYRLGDRNVFYITVVLVMTFMAILVPVQLEAHWVTAFWIAEAVFLFAAGRIKRIAIFEYLSYPLMFLGAASLLSDWESANRQFLLQTAQPGLPIFNAEFTASIFAAIAFGAICFVDRLRACKPFVNESFSLILRFAFPTVFLIVLYNAFRVEIGAYFYAREMSAFGTESFIDDALFSLDFVWQLIYTIFFVSLLLLSNIRKFRNRVLGISGAVLGILVTGAALTAGLFLLGELRALYISQTDADLFYRGFSLVLFRYILIGFLALLFLLIKRQMTESYISKYLELRFIASGLEIGLYLAVLVILSNELITWLDIFRIGDSFKLGLSVLWALYAVALIVVGIVSRKKHLRVFAISVFGLTLFKLFIVDLAQLPTISKTVVLVSVGVLLLIASFLYNKYTTQIFGVEDRPENRGD